MPSFPLVRGRALRATRLNGVRGHQRKQPRQAGDGPENLLALGAARQVSLQPLPVLAVERAERVGGYIVDVGARHGVTPRSSSASRRAWSA